MLLTLAKVSSSWSHTLSLFTASVTHTALNIIVVTQQQCVSDRAVSFYSSSSTGLPASEFVLFVFFLLLAHLWKGQKQQEVGLLPGSPKNLRSVFKALATSTVVTEIDLNFFFSKSGNRNKLTEIVRGSKQLSEF